MFELLDFYADWCGPCRAMAPIFEEIEKNYVGKVKFSKVDVEGDGPKAAAFNVMSIPTFVILKEGKEISRKTGAMPKDMLTSWIDESIR